MNYDINGEIKQQQESELRNPQKRQGYYV